MPTIEGSCLCGSARYTSDREPVTTAVCHCRDCQRQSGSAFSTVVAVPRDGLRLQGNTLTTFRHVGDSGQPVARHFCNRCGSPIFNELASMPGLAFIRAGTLDDSSWMRPEMHL